MTLGFSYRKRLLKGGAWYDEALSEPNGRELATTHGLIGRTASDAEQYRGFRDGVGLSLHVRTISGRTAQMFHWTVPFHAQLFHFHGTTA